MVVRILDTEKAVRTDYGDTRRTTMQKEDAVGFTLYGKIEVVYEGRASSTLEVGNHLIVCKPDGSIAIHGGELVKPLNYQGPGTKIKSIKDKAILEDLGMNLFSGVPLYVLEAKNKKETLLLAVYEVHHKSIMKNWACSKIKLIKSEHDLVNKMLVDISQYLPEVTPTFVDTETPTPYGSVDILVIDELDVRHIIEVKRRKAGTAAVGQVNRYGQWFHDKLGYTIAKYVAAPQMTNNALEYASAHEVKHIPVDFD